MDQEIPNWELEYSGDDGYSWTNTENDVMLAVTYDDEVDSWVVTGENSLVEKVDSMEEGYEYAVDYMQGNPRPSGML